MAPDGNKGGFGAHYPGRALASLFWCKSVFTSRVIFRQCFADRFADELDSSLRDFRFSVDEESKTFGVLRIADFLPSYYFPRKSWNYRLKFSQRNQKDSSHVYVVFVCNSCEL